MRRISITAVADLARVFAGEVRVFVVDCRANPWVFIQEQQFPSPPASAHLDNWPDDFVLISEAHRRRVLLALLPTGPVRIIPSRPGGHEAMKRLPR